MAACVLHCFLKNAIQVNKPICEHVSMGPFHHRKVKLCLPQRFYDLKETKQGDGGATGHYLAMGKGKPQALTFCCVVLAVVHGPGC